MRTSIERLVANFDTSESTKLYPILGLVLVVRFTWTNYGFLCCVRLHAESFLATALSNALPPQHSSGFEAEEERWARKPPPRPVSIRTVGRQEGLGTTSASQLH
jgi:hypothetical protein